MPAKSRTNPALIRTAWIGAEQSSREGVQGSHRPVFFNPTEDYIRLVHGPDGIEAHGDPPFGERPNAAVGHLPVQAPVPHEVPVGERNLVVVFTIGNRAVDLDWEGTGAQRRKHKDRQQDPFAHHGSHHSLPIQLLQS